MYVIELPGEERENRREKMFEDNSQECSKINDRHIDPRSPENIKHYKYKKTNKAQAYHIQTAGNQRFKDKKNRKENILIQEQQQELRLLVTCYANQETIK